MELFFDTETTTFQHGNPFSAKNKLCLAGFLSEGRFTSWDIEYTLTPYRDELDAIQDLVNRSTILVGFNIKFDLHWLQRYGIDFRGKQIWDCQIAEFILSNQTHVMPSLDATAKKYGLGEKIDTVKELWEAGIDTPDIDLGLLTDYLEQDVRLTKAVYEHQRKFLDGKRYQLVWLACQDALVTQEAEANGLLMDFELCSKLKQQHQQEIDKIDAALRESADGLPINWNSGDHLSAYLYGGELRYNIREEYERTLKSGETKLYSHWVPWAQALPRQVEPLEGTELKKKGYYATDRATLSSLKAPPKVARIIDMLLTRSKLEKLVSTYFDGWPKIYEKMDWTNNTMHGQLNHCVAVTGRLSSSNPNQQNAPKDIRIAMVSRFPLLRSSADYTGVI